MATTRRFTCDDLFRFGPTNLDALTETVSNAVNCLFLLAAHLTSIRHSAVQYNMSFYWLYLARWPDMCSIQESTSGRIMSYSEYNE